VDRCYREGGGVRAGAGHKRLGEIDGAFHLESTKQYIRKFGEILEGGAKDPKELFKGMMGVYGKRVNEGALLAGCVAAFARKKGGNKL
jgi:hypothetical protein